MPTQGYKRKRERQPPRAKKSRKTTQLTAAYKRPYVKKKVVASKSAKEVKVVGSYTRSATTVGRRPVQNLQAVWKFINANKSSTIFQFQRYTQFGGAIGQMILMNARAATGQYQTPLHMYDLTSLNNVSGGSVVNHNPMSILEFTNQLDTGVLSWNKAAGVDWSIVQSGIPANVFDAHPNAECDLEWVQVKMLAYCPSGQVTKYDVKVIQLLDEVTAPDQSPPVDYANAFWQSAVKPFACSPLDTGSVKYGRKMKVLHSQSFIMEPKESGEIGESNHYRNIEIFLRLNKVCRFDWDQNDRMGLLDGTTQANVGSNRTTVKQTDRVFLMIRAQAGFHNVLAPEFSKHPSYDIMIRKKISQLTS